MLSAFVQKPENDPFRRAQDERVTVEVLSTVRVAGDTWQVDWRESSWDKNGAPMGSPVVWRAMLRTLVQAPKTAEAMRAKTIDECGDIIREEAERLSDCGVAFAAEKMLERIDAINVQSKTLVGRGRLSPPALMDHKEIPCKPLRFLTLVGRQAGLIPRSV